MQRKKSIFCIRRWKSIQFKGRYLEKKIIKSKNVNSFQKEEKILPTEKKNKMVKI